MAQEPPQPSDTGGRSDTGDTGDPGDTGDTGNTGDPGDTGDTGDTGDPGDTGDTGDTEDTGDTVGPEAITERERARRAERARTMLPDLIAREVSAVAVTWVDNSGITRVKTVPVHHLDHAAAWGIGASPSFDAFLLDDSMISGRYAGGPVGDLRLHPDLDRIAVLAAPAGWAWAPADRHAQDGSVHPQDARTALRREVGRLADLGLTVRTAFEVEWSVSEGPGDAFTPASRGPAYGMARISELPEYLLDVLAALSVAGVDVEQLHPENAVGQFEVSVAAEEPLGAADTAVLVRETIRAVTHRHGMRASFAPKVETGLTGNGGHVHLSLWRDGANLMSGGDGPYGMGDEAEAFAAGVLARLPALLAVGCPSVASYLRLLPSSWAGAFACWGLENREAALRLVTGPAWRQRRAANLEIKCFDATANPYLVLAVILAAGRAGLTVDRAAGRDRLPEPVTVDPASLTPAERAARGIRALPSSLGEAVAAFEREQVLRDALGPPLTDTIAEVRRGEIALFADADPETIIARTRWRH